jgi:hypothetical protein
MVLEKEQFQQKWLKHLKKMGTGYSSSQCRINIKGGEI